MNGWLVMIGALSGAVLYYLFTCFVLWGIPAPLGEVEVYNRFFIGLFWVFFTVLGGAVTIVLHGLFYD